MLVDLLDDRDRDGGECIPARGDIEREIPVSAGITLHLDVVDHLVGTLRSAPDVGLAASSPAAFRTAVKEGRLVSSTPEVAYAFGKMSLAAFIDGLATPGLDEM